MKEYLTKFIGVPDENIFILTDDHATKTEIEILLQDKIKRLIKEGDTILLLCRAWNTRCRRPDPLYPALRWRP